MTKKYVLHFTPGSGETGYIRMAIKDKEIGSTENEDIRSTIQILQHGSGQNLLADPKVWPILYIWASEDNITLLSITKYVASPNHSWSVYTS